MKNPIQPEWEQWLDRELKQLPELNAPETLVPRVMQQIESRQLQPWWQRAWPTWPRGIRLVFVGVLTGLASWLAYAVASLTLGFSVAPLIAQLTEWTSVLSPVWQVLGAIGRAGEVVFRHGGQQFLVLGSALALVVYGFTVGLTTACYRFATQKA